jgi:hypothetical protein
MALKSRIAGAADPTTPYFWFVMSMGLLVGFIFAYPMNWWLVAYHLKHGMMTVRPAGAAAGAHAGMDAMPHGSSSMSMGGGETPWPPVPVCCRSWHWRQAWRSLSCCGRRERRAKPTSRQRVKTVTWD